MEADRTQEESQEGNEVVELSPSDATFPCS